ncbi:anti-sigma factor domain-containing protein [Spirosoma sp. KNUC1025]|uniref:anti-sigma factor n=1 Tax=Spirosoma sp. KNUC1025 TaxID=2894082 RepID=UPI00386F76CE
MGAVSTQERREVECLSSIYPEIKQELDQLTEALEEYAFLHSVEPPAALKTKLLQQLDFETPAVQPLKAEETIVRPMPVDPFTGGPTFRVTWIAAASMGLLLLFFSFYLLSQLRSNQKTLASTRSANESLQTQLRQIREKLTQTDNTLAMVSQPGLRTMELQGNEKAPHSNILLYWNTQTHEVAVQTRALPALPADKQYQLWSMVNGKPVDAGVFDARNESKLIQRLNRAVTRAEAFAVTVEKRGGSPTPTLSTLLALTPIKS